MALLPAAKARAKARIQRERALALERRLLRGLSQMHPAEDACKAQTVVVAHAEVAAKRERDVTVDEELSSMATPQKAQKVGVVAVEASSGIVSCCNPEQKVPTNVLKLTVVAALSGRCVANLDASSAWKVADMKSVVERLFTPGICVKDFLCADKLLPETNTLAECAISSGTTVQVTLGSMAVLFLASPCSARELSKRRGAWRLLTNQEANTNMVNEKIHHHSWEVAPTEAREIAIALQEATPGLASHRVCLTDYGLVGGEVIIIANADEDPRKACLQALRIRQEVEDVSDDEFEMNEDGGEDECWRMMQSEGEAGVHNPEAYATWLKHKDDPEYEGNLWALSTLRDADLKLHVSEGFNAAFDETGGSHAKDAAANSIAATQVMAERLERHFKFDFASGCCRSAREDLVYLAPVIYGGFAPDGSIVGILTARVKSPYHKPPDGSASEPGPEDEASDDES